MESMKLNFDVEKHEAITEIPVRDKKKKAKWLMKFRKDITLNDKLIVLQKWCGK